MRRRFPGRDPGTREGVNATVSAVELLRYPVTLRGIQLGRPVDLVLDVGAMRVVGLEVLCGDESKRFLPLPAARIRDGEVAIASALLLLDDRNVSFYRERGRTFRALRGAAVRRGRALLGTLVDAAFTEDGPIVTLLLAGPHGNRRVPVEPSLAIETGPRAPTA